jgi:hypothetical protein
MTDQHPPAAASPGTSVAAPPSPCSRCGRAHLTAKGGPACSAHSKRSGDPCANSPMKGQSVCRMHGGSAPAARASGQRRIERARIFADVGAVLDELEIAQDDTHPIDALLDAVRRARAVATVLGSMLDASNPGFGQSLELYERWLGLQARTAKLALEAGVEERQIRVTEEQAQQLAQALRSFAAGLLAAVVERVPGVAAAHAEFEALLPGLMVAAIESVHPTTAGPIVDVVGREEAR